MSTVTLELRPLLPTDCERMAPWFADAETNRWLGGAEWPTQVLGLSNPAGGRFAYAALCAGDLVGLLDVECYADLRASMALVVAPDVRGRGIGRRILDELFELQDLAHVSEFFGGVETGNLASQRLVIAAGFVAVTQGPDEEGFTYYARRRAGTDDQ